MSKSIEIDESIIEQLMELQKLNPKLKGYDLTELVTNLLLKTINREINKVEQTQKPIDLLDNNMEKLIESKEENIDKLNILETKA